MGGPAVPPTLGTPADELLENMARQVNGDIAHPPKNGVNDELKDSHAPDDAPMDAAVKERRIARRSMGSRSKSVCLSLGCGSGILSAMRDLEESRKLVGPETDTLTSGQVEQLQHEIDALAALLLDLYQSRKLKHGTDACGLPEIDAPQSDR